MNLIDYNHMVEKISAADSNPAFRYPILPGTAETDSLGFDTAGYQEINYIIAEFCITI
jgi:hypothetical protein